jgi:alpha-mannosidase
MRTLLFLLFIGCSILAAAQSDSIDLTQGRTLYTVGYTHLDTQWNWDYPTTIDPYLRRTLNGNFALLEKYPDYVFNFSGSRRYAMMKEYYPQLYARLKGYIVARRWYPASACVDEGEVNVSSSESLLRQTLYGNLFYEREFGTRAADYLLPDCFGFVATVPSVLAHAGILGFSTQKLTWKAAVPIPFNLGLWEGPDGKNVIAALNATNYAGRIPDRLDTDSTWVARIDDNIRRYNLHFDYRYYGIGDRGGAPREEDVQNVMNSIRRPNSPIRVLLTSSDQLFRDVTPTLRSTMPTYRGDLLLIEHSAGSLTSQSFLKRMNRKNEIAAKAAEQVAAIADQAYPFSSINTAWDLILGSQMHDILPGTAIPSACEYAWNDELVAANLLSSSLRSSVAALARSMDTQVKGRAVVVYNPVATTRTDVVSLSMAVADSVRGIRVIDAAGNSLPTQIIRRAAGSLDFLFTATVEPASLTIFDVQCLSRPTPPASNALKITTSSLENEFYSVKIAPNGDLISIYDKEAARDVLAHPASLEFLRESPAQWPAWNMDWADRQNPPIDSMHHNTFIRIVEAGPVRIALEINREGQHSSIVQTLSLAAGEAGRRIEIDNRIHWQSRGVSLKAAFPLAVSNTEASYSLDNAFVRRPTNHERQFEVPSRQWFDLTDRSGDYGVTILEDSRYGSDKPDDHTLRLTLMYTPIANVDRFSYQATQDFGIHEVKYGLYPHAGALDSRSAWHAKRLNQPLLAFEADRHNGPYGRTLSILAADSPQIDVMAFKKAENDEYIILRINELTGNKANNVRLRFFAPVIEAFEVDGQERRIDSASLDKGELITNMNPFGIRSFALRFASGDGDRVAPFPQIPLLLPYNVDVISANNGRRHGRFDAEGRTLPAEQLPDELTVNGVHFHTAAAPDTFNAVECRGQSIALPSLPANGKLYLLAAAESDTRARFAIDETSTDLAIQSWTGFIGQHYAQVIVPDSLRHQLLALEEPYLKTDPIAWFASHHHTPDGDAPYRYCYLYSYALPLPVGASTLTLPDHPSIKILAATAIADPAEILPLQKPYDDLSSYPPFRLHRLTPKPTQAHR